MLRERFSREPQNLVNKLLYEETNFGEPGFAADNQPERVELTLQMIRILSKRNPRWLVNYRHLVDKLIELWDHNSQWKKNLENQEFYGQYSNSQ